MKDKALKGEYSSPEVELIETMEKKVICQSGEVQDFAEGWEIDFSD